MVKYTPLDDSRNEIRLIHLFPGKKGDPLRCTLEIVSLDNPPPFDALSYVWGDASITKPMEVDGASHQITENLHGALTALRRRWQRRRIWADALCIDQSNVLEKNTQVPKMAQLYTTAGSFHNTRSNVVMWAGPRTEAMNAALNQIYAESSLPWRQMGVKWAALIHRWSQRVGGVFSTQIEVERCCEAVTACQGFAQFLELPYWTRMWTFQEFSLPDREPIWYCGVAQIHLLPSEALNEDRTDTMQRTLQKAADAIKKPRFEKGPGSDLFLHQLQTVGTLPWAEMHTYRVMFPGPLRKSAKHRDRNERNYDLLTYLLATTQRQCHDPRDRIYALYGLVPDLQTVYPPDYRNARTAEAVFWDTSVYMIQHQAWGHQLQWATFGMRDDALTNRSYPSWVCDLTMSSMQSPHAHHELFEGLPPVLCVWEGQKNAAPDHPCKKTHLSPDLATLHLWAYRLGSCRVVLRFADTPERVLDQIKDLLAEADTHGIDRTHMAYLCISHDLSAAVFSPPEVEERFDAMFAGVVGRELDEAFRHVKMALKKLQGKVLFSALESPFYCVGVSSIRDGDELVVSPHARVAMVLRPDKRGASSVENDGNYRMVGTAQVGGIMHENWQDENAIGKIASLPMTEFAIW